MLIIIFAEVLYTVQVSLRQHVLQPGPFLAVGLIAVTRRILVLTAELPRIAKDGDSIFRSAMIELGLLTVFRRREAGAGAPSRLITESALRIRPAL